MSDVSPAIRRARELDDAGRHDDAINELAHAAQTGDADAMTQLAKRIIVGDRAPHLMQQGLSLLADAVKMGSAEAAERMAVVHATGVLAGRPDWPAALRSLVLAAERGWTPARGQLAVLASMGPAARAQAQESEPQSPAAYLRDIDLPALLAPREGVVLHADPLIRHFPALLNRRVCEWLIDRARARLTRALVYDVASQKDVVHGARTNSFAVFNNMEADLVHVMVQSRLAAACRQPLTHLEAATVLHYGLGEEIVGHYDFVDPEKPGYEEELRRSGFRILTFLVYLNRDYEGGETEFPRLGLSFRGQQGDGLCFVNTHANLQADLRTLHCGRPPTAGEKWVFSQFIRNRGWRGPAA